MVTFCFTHFTALLSLYPTLGCCVGYKKEYTVRYRRFVHAEAMLITSTANHRHPAELGVAPKGHRRPTV